MNTTEIPPADLAQEPVDQAQEEAVFSKPEISGFDQGTRPLLSQPTLYLSIAVVFIVALVSLGNNPILFWSSFLGMAALSVVFHVLAERVIFKSKTEFKEFSAPFEGVFVVTFGSILPGLGLLAYGIYSLCTSAHESVLADLGKMALLLIVPLFNYSVWTAVRKGYLIRPRLVGLMNGLALGLSVSWSAIFAKYLLLPTSGSCKFGWMLLLCISPFMLFSALCLSIDLFQKTEKSIRRITTTFSLMGVLLSFLFVFAPMVRTFSIQSLIDDAKGKAGETQIRAISLLRSLATLSDLRPSKYPVSGFNLAELLISGRGLDGANQPDQDLFFKITGRSFLDSKSAEGALTQPQPTVFNPLVGSKIPGLSLVKSQFTGSIDSASLSSSIDWTMMFCNTSGGSQEARAEIHLPAGAVVSRATLWIDGEPHEAAFLQASKAQAVYDSTVIHKSDPLLVTMTAPDRILVQCFPVPAGHGSMKVRIGLKVPLETVDGKTCSLDIPSLADTNFSQIKRHRISVKSEDSLAKTIPGMEQRKTGEGYLFDGIIKTDHQKTLSSLIVRRSSSLTEFATPNAVSGKQYIVQRLEEITFSPKRLFVVVDPSESLKNSRSDILKVLSNLPAELKPAILIGTTPDADKADQELSAKTTTDALANITPDIFVGGQDNGQALRQALESAAESANGAVLWIHGPQPIATAQDTVLDLVHKVRLFDLQMETSQEPLIDALRVEDPSHQIQYVPVHHKSIINDVKDLVADWKDGSGKFMLKRTSVTTKPNLPIVSDSVISSQMTSLWASEEFERLSADGNGPEANKIASLYHFVTPTIGAVVVDTPKQKESRPKTHYTVLQVYVSDQPKSLRMEGLPGGMVGAPVDPRFGQSNEVGMMADFGYDTARDLSRVLTAISFLISLIVSVVYVRGRPNKTNTVMLKAISLTVIVPTLVHLMGTFMINNFGGLGGGL